MICQAKKAEKAPKRTVSSNMIGKNAGTVFQSNGFPCTISGYNPHDGPNSTTTAVNKPVMPPIRTTGLLTAVVVEFGDRKSTRLNSSHEWISYAVFCLRKKMIQKWSNRTGRSTWATP